MTDTDFHDRLACLSTFAYREDFERALIELFTTCDSVQRDGIRAAIQSGTLHPPKAWKNPTDYDRSDLSREQCVQSGLISMAIYGLGDDFRDDLMALGYVYNGAVVLGLDADVLLEHAAQLSEPTVAKFMRDFANRPPEGKSLHAWGLRIVQTQAGPWLDRIP